jgi:hypothetical protein
MYCPYCSQILSIILKGSQDSQGTSYVPANFFWKISLMSSLLKTLERLLDRYIRDEALMEYAMAAYKHTQQTSRPWRQFSNLVYKADRALKVLAGFWWPKWAAGWGLSCNWECPQDVVVPLTVKPGCGWAPCKAQERVYIQKTTLIILPDN